jgi:hypothetical protein
MVGGRRAVFGVFDSESRADRAADILTKSDFPISEVSVLVPAPLWPGTAERDESVHAPDRVPDPADSGAGLAGTLGLLAGLGSLSVPRIGPILAGGPIAENLRGISFGEANGELCDAFFLMGIREALAKRYEGLIAAGKILLSIHCDTPEEITQAKEIMERAGGEDVTSSGELSAENTKPYYQTVSGGNG